MRFEAFLLLEEAAGAGREESFDFFSLNCQLGQRLDFFLSSLSLTRLFQPSLFTFPGVAFALFIVLSSTGKDKVLSWFKKKEEPAPATGISSWFKRTKPAADAETGTAKPAAKPAAAAAPAAPAAAPAAKPAEVKVVAPPAAAPAAATAAAPAAAPAAAAAAPAAPSGVRGWFGGGVS